MIPRRRVSLRALLATLAMSVPTVLAMPARSQDFDLAAPAWPPATASGWLERALPPAARTPVLEAGVVRWHGLDELTTRSLAAGAGWRALRGGVGLSQTGEPDLGWTALAMALGAAVPRAGASLRIAARRDRAARADSESPGAEAGGGAWIDAREHLHVWASAPQIWVRGAVPPLERPLEIGAAVELGSVTLWVSRAGVPGGPAGGREGGLSTVAGPLALWITARDRPLRGGLGVAARAGLLRAACEVDAHPVLRETARLSLAIGGGR